MRQEALNWWKQLMPYEQKIMLNLAQDIIIGGKNRLPHTLTGLEIENLYNLRSSIRTVLGLE